MSIVGIVAIPGAMLVLSGYVDLSVGLGGRAGAWRSSAQMAKVHHHSIGLAVDRRVLVVGAAWGLMNGVLIAYLGSRRSS